MRLLFIFLLLLSYNSYSQLANHHLTSIGNLPYNIILNDIWGYVDSSGTEYALVGDQTGLSIVSLADPANPVEIEYISANFSIWRDIKTYGSRAYSVTEGGGGILIVDLSDLPNSVSHHFHTDQVGSSAHNLWIDEQGYLYTAGSGLLGGQPVFYDLNINPDTPVLVGSANPNFYSHDLYARGDTMWSANINDGFFTVFDVSDKSNPQLLATQTTSYDFCHNVWLSDDGKTLFTTDEKSNAWIEAYDVSDLSDIRLLDRWRTPNPDVVPHNVHVHNDYLVVSYYDDGLVILDGSRPENLVEVARYDTYPLTPFSTFDGAWGAYPFLPSGRILVSDRQTGLHILQPNYVRACWLEGIVTDSVSGNPIFGVDVSITGNIPPDSTDILGAYKTGTVNPGTYQVTFNKFGYLSKTITTTLQNGILTIENVALVPTPKFLLEINIKDNQSSNGIGNAVIELRGPDTTYVGQSNAQGVYQKNILPGDYKIWIGHWGHQTQLDSLPIFADATMNVRLDRGYKDEFSLDLGWVVSSTVTNGSWVRQRLHSIPNFIFPFLNTDANDLGEQCITTGTYPIGLAPVEWLDSGTTTLSSPIMDLSATVEPYLSFQYHYYNLLPIAPGTLEVFLSNGTDTIRVLNYATPNHLAVWKTSPKIFFKNYLPLTNTMQVHFKAHNHDPNAAGRVRVWIDDFQVLDSLGNHIAIHQVQQPEPMISVAPNPFQENVQISYDRVLLPAQLNVVNALGQVIESHPLERAKGHLQLGQKWANGIYFVKLGEQTLRIVKQQ